MRPGPAPLLAATGLWTPRALPGFLRSPGPSSPWKGLGFRRSRQAGPRRWQEPPRSVRTHLEESTDLGELGLGSEEAEGQDRANVLRYGVEMGDEAVRHLRGSKAEVGTRRPPPSWALEGDPEHSHPRWVALDKRLGRTTLSPLQNRGTPGLP